MSASKQERGTRTQIKRVPIESLDAEVLSNQTSMWATVAPFFAAAIATTLLADTTATMLGLPTPTSLLGPAAVVFHVPMLVLAVFLTYHSPIGYNLSAALQGFRDAASSKSYYAELVNIVHSMLHGSSASDSGQDNSDSGDATGLAKFLTHAGLLLATIGFSYLFGQSWNSSILPLFAGLLMYAAAILTLLGARVFVVVLAWVFNETDVSTRAGIWAGIAIVTFCEIIVIPAVISSPDYMPLAGDDPSFAVAALGYRGLLLLAGALAVVLFWNLPVRATTKRLRLVGPDLPNGNFQTPCRWVLDYVNTTAKRFEAELDADTMSKCAIYRENEEGDYELLDARTEVMRLWEQKFVVLCPERLLCNIGKDLMPINDFGGLFDGRIGFVTQPYASSARGQAMLTVPGSVFQTWENRLYSDPNLRDKLHILLQTALSEYLGDEIPCAQELLEQIQNESIKGNREALEHRCDAREWAHLSVDFNEMTALAKRMDAELDAKTKIEKLIRPAREMTLAAPSIIPSSFKVHLKNWLVGELSGCGRGANLSPECAFEIFYSTIGLTLVVTEFGLSAEAGQKIDKYISERQIALESAQRETEQIQRDLQKQSAEWKQDLRVKYMDILRDAVVNGTLLQAEMQRVLKYFFESLTQAPGPQPIEHSGGRITDLPDIGADQFLTGTEPEPRRALDNERAQTNVAGTNSTDSPF
jgi:hypothetical protein